MKLYHRSQLILFSLLFPLGIFAQYTPQDEAIKLFEEGAYTEALPAFKRLAALFPKDPRYQYYAGVCMVQSNTSLKLAVQYLTQAAEKSVPRNVYFFLGKAWHYQYQFSKALNEYLRFQQFADRAEKDRLQCDMHIAMARAGAQVMEQACKVLVYAADTVAGGELFNYYNKHIKGGKFQAKTERGFLFQGAKNRTTWRFVPSWLDKNQAVYESSAGALRKNRDLVLVRKLNDNDWSKPENLGPVINSPFDEDYVYFNQAEPALYFASKGHNSMGGYDIFKSVYNPNANTWSAPVNLGYPINSPYDDFLFVPSDDQLQVFVASNRATSGDKFVVYSFSFSKNYTYTPRGSDIDLAFPQKNAMSQRPLVKEGRNQPKTISSEATAQNYGNNGYPEELLHQKDYNYQLNQALSYQLQSDSVSRLAEDVRQKILLTKSDPQKEALKREIYSLEQKSKTLQAKADEYYGKARAYEIKFTGKQPVYASNSQVNGEKVRNALKKHDTMPASQTGNAKNEKSNHVKPPLVENKAHVVYEFKIMAKSPYTSLGQIPMNQPLPLGLLYRVQMGAFSKPIEPNRFKGVYPISGETLNNGTVAKYYAGFFSRFPDAEKALNRIRELGFRDSYIVSYFDGKSIPVSRAKGIENDR